MLTSNECIKAFEEKEQKKRLAEEEKKRKKRKRAEKEAKGRRVKPQERTKGPESLKLSSVKRRL